MLKFKKLIKFTQNKIEVTEYNFVCEVNQKSPINNWLLFFRFLRAGHLHYNTILFSPHINQSSRKKNGTKRLEPVSLTSICVYAYSFTNECLCTCIYLCTCFMIGFVKFQIYWRGYWSRQWMLLKVLER